MAAARTAVTAHGRELSLSNLEKVLYPERFFEKMCPKHRPDWVETLDIWAPGPKRTVRYCRIDEPAALVWTAHLAALEADDPQRLRGSPGAGAGAAGRPHGRGLRRAPSPPARRGARRLSGAPPDRFRLCRSPVV